LISLATREVSILQQSDDHPNIVRYFYQESDSKYFYIALDLCPGSLADVIEYLDSDADVGDKRREEWKDIARGLDERKAMKQIASGLRHLHGLGLVHRDIKPQNILISSSSSSRGPHRMLISDFGLCKKLDVDPSRFLSTTYGKIAAHTAGWRSPEMLQCMDDELESLDTLGSSDDNTMSSLATTIDGSSSDTSTTTCQCLTKSVDIFALGCLFYYILTGGVHPYGSRLDREANIRNGIKDLSLISSNEEAHDLITHLLHRQPSQRLDIETCLLHPFFWNPGKRLGFLRDVSDRFEIMCKDPMDSVLIRLERDARSIIKTDDWYQTVDQILINNLRKSRGYDGNSLRDLLRVLRNKVSFSFKYIFLYFC
jgi:serine/threonine-protein kinase/endoribonuclease IRE1